MSFRSPVTIIKAQVNSDGVSPLTPANSVTIRTRGEVIYDPAPSYTPTWTDSRTSGDPKTISTRASSSSLTCLGVEKENLPCLVSELDEKLPCLASENENLPCLASEDDFILDSALEFTKGPISAHPGRLIKPVVVPQVYNGIGTPFARAYSDDLAQCGVSNEEFLQFIDNFNVVATASPPLQVLDLVGNIISFIPHEGPMIAGMAMQGVAAAATYVLSKTRGDAYIKRANSEFFSPRGLKATLCTSKALISLLNLPPTQPLVMTLDESNANISVQDRRMNALQGHVSSMTFDQTPPVKQEALLARLSAWQVKREAKSAEKKLVKGRAKGQKDVAREEKRWQREKGRMDRDRLRSESRGETKSGASLYVEQRMTSLMNEQRAKSQSKTGAAGYVEMKMLNLVDRNGKEERAMEKINDKAKKDKEYKAAKKIVWIVIESLDPAEMEKNEASIDGTTAIVPTVPTVSW